MQVSTLLRPPSPDHLVGFRVFRRGFGFRSAFYVRENLLDAGIVAVCNRRKLQPSIFILREDAPKSFVTLGAVASFRDLVAMSVVPVFPCKIDDLEAQLRAGEIAVRMPGKRIDLVSSTATLFPNFAPALGRRLLMEFSALKVSVHLGTTTKGLREVAGPASGPLGMAGQPPIVADLISRRQAPDPTMLC